MRIGVIGAGRIGFNAARRWADAGHELLLSYARDPSALAERAASIGARTGSPREAADFGEVVLLSVPWARIDEVLAEAGPLDGRIVVDTTNQFGGGGLEALPEGRTAAQVNAARMAGARYTKAFNTLTSAFQAEATARTGADRVAMFMCGDDEEAKAVVAGLIDDAGFVAIDVGGTADAAVMEAPRRDGAVYGEEFGADDARAFLAARRG
jgi:8-hydroxy-5-deazaflavin:NADPH oxidoreductase